MTRCTALELAPKQVRVNAVNPGVIKTELHLRSGKGQESYVKVSGKIFYQCPLVIYLMVHFFLVKNISSFEANYSRIDQVKCVEDSL